MVGHLTADATQNRPITIALKGNREMFTSRPIRRAALWAACAFALTYSVASNADDMASFATAGYASGLHSMKLMHKIDTDGDGMVSKDEWLAFHEKVFAMLDKYKSGNVNAKEFISPTGGDLSGIATGGFARGLRTKAMMHKIDTDGDGMVSKAEWLAFQEKVFATLDKNKNGNVDAKEFISSTGGDVASFATGGYAKGLRTPEMMHKIDTDGDGMVSHDEYIAYQSKVFDMMDTSTSHKGMLGKEEMLATGGANTH